MVWAQSAAMLQGRQDAAQIYAGGVMNNTHISDREEKWGAIKPNGFLRVLKRETSLRAAERLE